MNIFFKLYVGDGFWGNNTLWDTYMYTRRRQAASIAAGMLVVHVCLWCMRLLVDVVIFVVLCRVAEVILEWLCGDTVFFVCFKLNVCVFSRVSYSVYICTYI